MEVVGVAVEDRHRAGLEDGAPQPQDLDLLPLRLRHHEQVLGAQVAGGDAAARQRLEAVDEQQQQGHDAQGGGAGELREGGAVEILGDQEGVGFGEAVVEHPRQARMPQGLEGAAGGEEALALLLGLAAVAADQLDGDRLAGREIDPLEDVAGGGRRDEAVQPVTLGDPAQLSHPLARYEGRMILSKKPVDPKKLTR